MNVQTKSVGLRIVVGQSDHSQQSVVCNLLTALGHQVVAVATAGQDLITAAASLQPDLLLTDVSLGGIDGLDAAAQIFGARRLPIVIVFDTVDAAVLNRVAAPFVMTCLTPPITMADLQVALSMAVKNFKTWSSIYQETETLRRALADREVIEQAKVLLMRNLGLSEADAFRRLQAMAWNSNRKLVEVSEMIIVADEALDFTSGKTDDSECPDDGASDRDNAS